MRLILTCALFSSLAQAAPRVSLITLGGSAEIARAEVESVGLAAVPLPIFPLAGRLAELAEQRKHLAQAVDDARQAFIATRFADARAIADRAERETKFRGEPEVARRLAELSVMAALCGDKDGFARANAELATLKLDPAKWSPAAREGLERARGQQQKRARLVISNVPAFVDGVAFSEGELAIGKHQLLALGSDFFVDQTIELTADLTLTPSGDPASQPEQLALLRLRLEAGIAPSPEELALVSRVLDVETTLFADTSAADWREALRVRARAIVADCSLHHTPPERARAQKPLQLRVETGRCVAAVRGTFGAQGKTLSLEANVVSGSATLQLPGDLLPMSDRPYVLDYRLSGVTFHRARTDETAPMRVLVESPPLPRWYKKWWVWTLVGAAVTAVVVTSVVATLPTVTDVRLVGGGQ
jgi:hypothetical protein